MYSTAIRSTETSLIRVVRNVTGRASRNVNRLFVPLINTNYGKHSFYYCGTTLWNALPTALYDPTTFTKFRNSYLRTFLVMLVCT